MFSSCSLNSSPSVPIIMLVHCTLLVVLWLLTVSRFRLLAVELFNTAELLDPFQRMFGTILVTVCLMVWDWGGLKRRANTFQLAYSALSLCLFFFLPSFGRVGLGSSDWLSVLTLSAYCTADSFLIIKIINLVNISNSPKLPIIYIVDYLLGVCQLRLIEMNWLNKFKFWG